MKNTIGYIRVSTDKQDHKKQRHLLLDWAQKSKRLIDDFIEIEISSGKSKKERRIEELICRLSTGDTLVVAELSRLGRNMLEVLNIIEALKKSEIEIVFVRQPELSTSQSHGKLLLAIYSYFAEAEREFIRIRTKQGLEAARKSGIKLGRPKGSKNKKEHPLTQHKDQISQLKNYGVSVSSIKKIIDSHFEHPLSYSSYHRFVNTEIN